MLKSDSEDGSKENKNVLLIIPGFNLGGAQKSFSKVANDLNKDFNVFVACFNFDGAVKQDLDDLKVLNLEVPGGHNLFFKLLYFIKRIKRLKQLKKKYNISIAISFLEGANYVNVLSRYKERVVLSIRASKGSDVNITGIIGKLRKKVLLPFLYQKADCLTAVNQRIKNELEDDFKIQKPIYVVPNYFYLNQLREKANTELPEFYKPFFQKYNFITSIGRLKVDKGFHHLIHIYALFRRRYPHNSLVKLAIAGAGDYKPHLIEACRNNSLNFMDGAELDNPDKEPDVFFLGYQSNPLKFLAKSELFTLASACEGFPNSLVEGLVSCTCCLAADIPSGPRELLKGKNDELPEDSVKDPYYLQWGILMPSLFENDLQKAYEKWSNTFDEILNNKRGVKEQYASNGINAIKPYSYEEVYQKWFKLVSG